MDKGAMKSWFVVMISRFRGSGTSVNSDSILFFHSFCSIVMIWSYSDNWHMWSTLLLCCTMIRLSRLFNKPSRRLSSWSIVIWFWCSRTIDSDNNNKLDLFKIKFLLIYITKLIDTRNRSCFSWYCFSIPDKNPPLPELWSVCFYTILVGKP